MRTWSSVSTSCPLTVMVMFRPDDILYSFSLDKGLVKIFPDRFVSLLADHLRNDGRGTLISNVELFPGLFLRLFPVAFVKMTVSPGLGAGPGAHRCDAERDKTVAQVRVFPG